MTSFVNDPQVKVLVRAHKKRRLGTKAITEQKNLLDDLTASVFSALSPIMCKMMFIKAII